MGGGKGWRSAFLPAVGDEGGEPFSMTDGIVGKVVGKGDGIAMGAEHERHGDIPAEVAQAECEVEGEPGNRLGGIQLFVEKHVANRGPSGLARELDVQTVFLENPKLVSHRDWGTVV